MDAQRGNFWPQPPSGVAARSEIGNFRRPYTAGPGPRVPRRAERDDPIRAAGRSILQIRENESRLANFSYFAGINEIGEDKPAMTLQHLLRVGSALCVSVFFFASVELGKLKTATVTGLVANGPA